MSSKHSPIEATQRRSWPLDEKRRLVELTLQPGASVGSVAKEHRLDPPTLSSWRTLYRKGLLELTQTSSNSMAACAAFLPVNIHEALPSSGQIILHIHTPKGLSLRLETAPQDFKYIEAALASILQ